jgi:transposase
MGAHKVRSEVITLDVADTGRRRRWSDAEKLRIVAEAEAGSRLVSATARRHGVSRSQLMKWRRLADAGLLSGDGPRTPCAPTGFARVVVAAAASDGAAVAPAPPERIEIVLVNGRRLIVAETVGAAALIVTAKLNNVDPQAWLADVLGRIAGMPASKMDDLLPWNWAAQRQATIRAA